MPGLNTNNMALLRLADKLVRDGDLKGALNAILKAREADPTNRYAEAYEDRVRSLLGEKTANPEGQSDAQGTPPDSPARITLPQDEQARAAAPSEPAPTATTPHTAPTQGAVTQAASGQTAPPSAGHQQTETSGQQQPEPSQHRLAEIVALLDQANAAIVRSNFPEALEYIGKARQLDPENNDVLALEEEIRAACESASPTQPEHTTDFDIVRSTLEAYTAEAMELAAAGEFEEALHLVTKGFVLDPSNQELRSAEQQILVARQIHDTQEQAIALAEQHYRQIVDAQRHDQEDLARHIARARASLEDKSLDDALTEVALGYTIDPNNHELQDIERAVWQAEISTGTLSEPQKNEEEVARLIKLHILAAEEFAKNGDFVKALDDLAKAYVIDPANIEIKRAEVRIRQAELRHHQAAGSPLKLVYHHDRVVNGE